MISKLKTAALGGATAIALTLAAGAASALTLGTIPGVGAINEGIGPVYGAGTTSVQGWYGAQLSLLGGNADIKVEYLGSEAGRTNDFVFGGSTLFSTPGIASVWTPAAGSTTIANVATGLLDFHFTGVFGNIVNGSNIDGAPVASPPNFFVTFNQGNATSGNSVDIWFDDGGAGFDDNHDDMMIRLSVTSGSISIVPVPASVPLLLTALGGLGFMARRKRKSA